MAVCWLDNPPPALKPPWLSFGKKKIPWIGSTGNIKTRGFSSPSHDGLLPITPSGKLHQASGAPSPGPWFVAPVLHMPVFESSSPPLISRYNRVQKACITLLSRIAQFSPNSEKGSTKVPKPILEKGLMQGHIINPWSRNFRSYVRICQHHNKFEKDLQRKNPISEILTATRY